MNIQHRFNHSAYAQMNSIQQKMAQDLLTFSPPRNNHDFLDLGCGNGTVFKYLHSKKRSFRAFFAVDFSPKLLALHPDVKNVRKIILDFDNQRVLQKIVRQKTVYANASLQWSVELKKLLFCLNKNAASFHVALFTSGTFKNLHQNLALSSPLPSKFTLQKMARALHLKCSAKKYHLHFKTCKEALVFIQKSGISAHKKSACIKNIRAFIRQKGTFVLTFEAVFCSTVSTNNRYRVDFEK